jgi:hypothetical protein
MLISNLAFATSTLIIMVSKLNVLPQFKMKNITQEVFWRLFSPPGGAVYKDE